MSAVPALLYNGAVSEPESDLPRGIGRPATNALAVQGYTRLDDVTRLSEKELLAMHGGGPKAVRLLSVALSERGLSFRPD